jgi:hypothetical protein
MGSSNWSFGVCQSTNLSQIELEQLTYNINDPRLPRKPEGEWWELSDQNRGGRSYFYRTSVTYQCAIRTLAESTNYFIIEETVTGETRWTRPTDDLVIPLGMIQVNALGERSTGSEISRVGINAGTNGQERGDFHPDKDGKGTWGKDTKRRNRAYPPPLQESVTSALHKRGSPITITGNTRHSRGAIAPFLPYEAHNTPQKSPSSALPSKDFRSGKSSIPIELGSDKMSHIDNRSGMFKSVCVD